MNLKEINELHEMLIQKIIDKDIHAQCESIAKRFGKYYKSNWVTDDGEYNYRLIINGLDIHLQTWVDDNNFMEITVFNKLPTKMLFGYRKVDNKEIIDEYISGEWEDIINDIYNNGVPPEIKNEQNNNGIYNRVINWFKNKKGDY